MRGGAAAGEVDLRTRCLAMFRNVPREGSRAQSPEPSHVAVTSQLPTGQIPWGVLGRWPPYPILLLLSLPRPPECISCCLPGGPLPWPHLSWQPLPEPLPLLLPDT